MKIPTEYPLKGTPGRKRKKRVWNLIQREGAWCCVCGQDNPKKLTIDHLYPKKLGGGNQQENLQFLCKRCHSVKNGAKRVKPWFWG